MVGALQEFTAEQSAAVKGVFVIGNPRHKPGLACNVDLHGGDSTKDATGIFYDEKQFIPDSYVGRTMDVCNFVSSSTSVPRIVRIIADLCCRAMESVTSSTGWESMLSILRILVIHRCRIWVPSSFSASWLKMYSHMS